MCLVKKIPANTRRFQKEFCHLVELDSVLFHFTLANKKIMFFHALFLSC